MAAFASSSNHDPDFLPRIDRVAALAAISPDTPQVRWIAPPPLPSGLHDS